MKPTCIQCKHYKIEDALSGYCRAQLRESRDRNTPAPMVRQDDTCEKWADCGQHYYIRLGWLKALSAKKEGMGPQ